MKTLPVHRKSMSTGGIFTIKQYFFLLITIREPVVDAVKLLGPISLAAKVMLKKQNFVKRAS